MQANEAASRRLSGAHSWDGAGGRGGGGEAIPPRVVNLWRDHIYHDLLPEVHYRPKQRIFYLLFQS